MKKETTRLISILMIFVLSGCASWNGGYKELAMDTFCNQCKNGFKISRQEYLDNNVVVCPVCKHEERAKVVRGFYVDEWTKQQSEERLTLEKKEDEKMEKARLEEEERVRNQEHGLVCIQCERHFFLIGWQLELSDKAICPYCEKEQNMQPALNRYIYDTHYQQQQVNQQQNQQAYQQLLQAYQQQLNAQRTTQAISDVFRTQAEYGRRKEQLFLDYADTFKKPAGSSRFRPIYVSPGY